MGAIFESPIIISGAWTLVGPAPNQGDAGTKHMFPWDMDALATLQGPHHPGRFQPRKVYG